MKRMLVTGSGGLIGSETVRHFVELGWSVTGIENNMRERFFGPGGSVGSMNQAMMELKNFTRVGIDIQDRQDVDMVFAGSMPFNAIVHCAGQPSHEFSIRHPNIDWDVNAGGTMNLLLATKKYCPNAPFVFMSSNKVYGERVNDYPRIEKKTRYDFEIMDGIDEYTMVDRVHHSPFGASKLAADIMVQEFGLQYGIPTVCFRASCITGAAHRAVQLHGFPAHLVTCAVRDELYTIIGFEGKQVRDHLHARDLVHAFELFIEKPKSGAVYNIGGGRHNSLSVLEAIDLTEMIIGRNIETEYDANARDADHVVYITNFERFHFEYPDWKVKVRLGDIIREIGEDRK